jgi:hypothetical protein
MALLYGELGVWAGTTEVQRRGLYRRLAAGISVSDVLDQTLDDRAAEWEPLEDAA